MQRKTLDISKQKRHLCLPLSGDLSTSYVFVPEGLVNKRFSEQRNTGQPGPEWAGRKAAQVSTAVMWEAIIRCCEVLSEFCAQAELDAINASCSISFSEILVRPFDSKL